MFSIITIAQECGSLKYLWCVQKKNKMLNLDFINAIAYKHNRKKTLMNDHDNNVQIKRLNLYSRSLR